MQGRLQMWSAAHCWFTLIHTWEKLIHADLHLKTSISGKRIYGSIMRSCDSMFLLAKGMRKVSSFVRSCLTKMRWTACMSFMCHGGTEQEQKDHQFFRCEITLLLFPFYFPNPLVLNTGILSLNVLCTSILLTACLFLAKKSLNQPLNKKAIAQSCFNYSLHCSDTSVWCREV